MWATRVLLLLGWRAVAGDGDVYLNSTAPPTPSTSLRIMTPLLPEPVTDLTMLENLMTQLWGNNDIYSDKGNGYSSELFNLTNRRALHEDSTPGSSTSPSTKIGSSSAMTPSPTPAYAQSNDTPMFRAEAIDTVKEFQDAKAISPEKLNQLRDFLDKYNVIRNQIRKNDTQAEEPVPRSQDSKPELSGHVPVLRMKIQGPDNQEFSGGHLDMSPARGGKIHSLRARNRLCQRHVMIPEGPKYDSKGKPYLRQYVRIKDRDYAHTVAPKLLLPKCCNCCKKSVLGCE